MVASDPVDGIIWMATYPAIFNLGEPPHFNTAYSENKVTSDLFAFRLASSGSDLYLGETASALYNGSVEYHSINSNTQIYANQSAQCPPRVFRRLLLSPMQLTPTVAFSWGGKSWTVSSANFNLGETCSGSGQCVGALAGQDLGLGNNV
ncbi:hypothetical protein JAAARDRAFT_211118 [Jaapia argillacea MUCL 33604]|uniref:Peptidase A1 domain-containing protein n=1 Tax=Jaapia argillacea MUCL 33604 TaxID=933084 RepID=A0A067P8U6_9AGAM|nr:hypothetical protein JAAARDRAFT_211118 [Jaapia argillacea MUCL 33604]